jgi:uncharacterized membrane protein
MEARLHLKRISLRLPGLVAALTLLAAVAHAEAIPEKYIAVERQSCNQACTQDDATAQPCAQYCDCTMRKMKSEITLDELATVSRDATKDEQAPSTAVNKLAKIATACAQATPR